ncbi:phosphotransferase family protein [Pseudonocardia kunmingensis]|uniref:Aminoglycoside phosphotransferase (APT) family kinase protein n=1 Tax=Pseudonocardia kunmingensis TaxID=630975 RepID=A0A543DPW0_9PSEU|nr:phosphotransferase family protein [Pseudonocardia kunmingensis]TQM11344.1 aminoglycoside phosphotransferase (APT) family kinase protein [Pseudonocardia kunmingensis]
MSIVTSSDELVEQLTARTAVAVRGWAPDAGVVGIEPLTGGASSLTYVAELSGAPRGDERIVLKVAPPGLAPVRNRDVLRQARLMEAVEGKPGVRVPRVLFSDVGDPPHTPPFLAMALVPGDCVEPVLAPRGTLPPAQVRARALDAARMLAALHRVDPVATALATEPVVSLGAEIDRWTRAFTTVPDDLSEGYEAVADRLHATMPPAMAPVVTHGDYRIGNTLCEGDRVTAIIDWEIWSLGDPRVDITWFTFFTDEAQHPAAPSAEPTGMPTKAEIVDAYHEARGELLTDLRWFEALTKYKESAATALLIKRGRRSGPLNESMRRMLPALAQLRREAMALVSP